MLDLLKLEWHKWRKNRLMQILLLAYLIFLPASIFLGKKIPLDEVPMAPSQDIFFQFPTMWKFLGYAGNWITFFVFGFMAVQLITSEYSYKTFRQNLITGLTRTQFFLSKLQLITVLSLFATIYFLAVGFVIGYMHLDGGEVSNYFEDSGTAFRYFLMVFGYMVFGFFIGTFIRRSGIAIITYFSYIMVVELILRWLIHVRLFKNKSMHFYPMNAVEDLMPLPFGDVADGFIQEYQFSFFLTFQEAISTTLVYSGIFLLLIFLKIRRSDI